MAQVTFLIYDFFASAMSSYPLVVVVELDTRVLDPLHQLRLLRVTLRHPSDYLETYSYNQASAISVAPRW